MEKEEKKKQEEEKKIREYEKNKKEKNEARRKESKCNDVQEENAQKEGTSLPITKSEFDRVEKKAQEKTKMVKSGLLKIKEKAQDVRALTEEKKDAKLREREKLLSQIEKVALFGKKHKDKEMTFGEHCEEFEKKIEELSTLKDEASGPKKKR